MKRDKYLLFFILIPFLLVLVWFKDGKLLATGEEGLHIYNATRSFNYFKNVWVDVSTGVSDPFDIATLPLYGLLAFLQIIGFSPWFSQAILFFILLLIPLVSMYKLSELLMPGGKISTKFVISLFYLFNLFTMTQVWQRFIYALILLWSFLPLFLILWIKWLNKHTFKNLMLFAIVSVLFSYTFTLIVNVPTIWFPAVGFWIFQIFKNKSHWKNLVFYGAVGILTWLIFNIWWIYPLGQVKNTSYAAEAVLQGELDSLRGVSKAFPNFTMFLLKHDGFFGKESLFYNFYSNISTLFISVIIFIITTLGVIKNRKIKIWPYLFGILITGWFISKGTNFPLGLAFYNFLFSNFPISVIYRNSYEKFGVIWLFSYSFFFGLGLSWIIEKFKQNKTVVWFTSLFIFCIFLVWPLWTGKMFADRVHVTVPKYYDQTNEYLKSRNVHRIFQLPYNEGVGIVYTWGFIGIDPIDFLYDSPSIFVTRRDLIDNIYTALPSYFKNENFPNILTVLDISHIILRKDVLPGAQGIHSIEEDEKAIKNWKSINFERSIGKLDIYSLDFSHDINSIYAVDKLVLVNNYKDLMDLVISKDFDPKKQAVYVQSKNIETPIFKNTNTIPDINFIKISPSFYKVFVKNATEDFILILADSYNNGWQVKGSSDLMAEMSEHFIVNGYANGWRISKKGDYEFNLVFKVWPWD